LIDSLPAPRLLAANNETPWKESYAASLDFALNTHRDLVDGVFPMCTHLNCGTNDGVVAQPPATWLKTPAQEGGVSKTPLAF